MGLSFRRISVPIMTTSLKGNTMKLNVPPALTQAWNDQPLAVIAIGAAATASAAKLIDALSAAQGRRAYAKQVNNSVKKSKK